jgi:multiple antibiotic resistance protein
MEDLNRSVVTLLALINPVICGVMLLQRTPGASHRQRLVLAGNVLLRAAAILLISAAIGPQLLHRLGISLDVFQIVGGVVITSIGYGMFAPGPTPAAPVEENGDRENPSSLDPIVLFAASPGTISTALALSVAHGPDQGLLAPIAAMLIALAINTVVMAVMVLRPGSSAGRNSSLISRFLGLILIAMGLQLALTNLRAFFQLSS